MPVSGITTNLRPCPLVSLSVLRYLASSAQRLRQSRSSTVTLSSLTRVSVLRAGRESGSQAATRAIACPFRYFITVIQLTRITFRKKMLEESRLSETLQLAVRSPTMKLMSNWMDFGKRSFSCVGASEFIDLPECFNSVSWLRFKNILKLYHKKVRYTSA